jgi:hypothetical protein
VAEDDFKFDVAFSFVASDEGLATEINDRLQDRLSTFLYSKQQEGLAGTDGEQTFSEVFGKQARVVVVLYRKEWGHTRWTRIEETAIRGRAFDAGYDFTLFIPLDDTHELPKWLPKTRIWFDLARWGTSGAAAVIEQKAREKGSTPHTETVLDRAARLQRTMEYESKRRSFLASFQGVNTTESEAGKLSDELQTLVAEDSISGIGIQHKRDNLYTVLLRGRLGLSVGWRGPYTNTLDGSGLRVILWDGHPPMRGITHWEQPQRLDECVYGFDLTFSGPTCWKNADGKEFSTEELAAHVVKYCLDQINQRLRE